MRKVLPTLLGVTVGVVLGSLATQHYFAREKTKLKAVADFSQLDRLMTVFERVRDNYVDERDPSHLVDAAIKGITGTLDPHSEYIGAIAFRDMRVSHRPSASIDAGIGIDAMMENGVLKVITPIDDTPAAKAGIRANDIITHVDGAPVRGLILYEAMEKTRGSVGTTVRLTIMRQGQDKPVELTLVREMILNMRAVRARRDAEDVGYIRIRLIAERTMDALKKALSELSRQGPADTLKGYVLDLRNLAHGQVDEAVAVADAFLDDGEIVSVRGRRPEQTKRFYARPGDLTDGKPLVVLINGGSASGAEIIAGALQHHRRATLVGTRSFGLGSVPSIVPIHPRGGALRLTTARYVTPAGHSIATTGIVPDIEVQDHPDDATKDPALALAYDLLRGIAHHAAFPPSGAAAPLPQ